MSVDPGLDFNGRHPARPIEVAGVPGTEGDFRHGGRVNLTTSST